MHVIYSTITCDTDYVAYKPGSPRDASAIVTRRIRIKGGANLAPLTGNLITPKGVATVVSDEIMDFLESNEAFRRHRDRGFIKVEKGGKARDADIVAKTGMTSKDASAPMIKSTIAEHCGERTANVEVVVEPTESSKARMK